MTKSLLRDGLRYLVRGVEAVATAVRVSPVQQAHLPAAGLQRDRPVVVVGPEGLDQGVVPVLQAVVDVHRVVGPQPQLHLQHDGPRVLGVQQPGAPQLGHGAPGRPGDLLRGE